MRRIALLALPLFILTACERGLPTAAEIDSPALAVTLDAELTTINLFAVPTIEVVIPTVSAVPTTATLTNDANDAFATPIHVFDVGCDTHFTDVDGDSNPDLLLHFNASDLFGSYGTVPPEESITLTLAVTWVDAEGNVTEHDAVYSVQLVYTVPNGFRGGH